LNSSLPFQLRSGRLFQGAFFLGGFFALVGEGFEDVHVNAGFFAVAAVAGQDGGDLGVNDGDVFRCVVEVDFGGCGGVVEEEGCAEDADGHEQEHTETAGLEKHPGAIQQGADDGMAAAHPVEGFDGFEGVVAEGGGGEDCAGCRAENGDPLRNGVSKGEEEVEGAVVEDGGDGHGSLDDEFAEGGEALVGSAPRVRRVYSCLRSLACARVMAAPRIKKPPKHGGWWKLREGRFPVFGGYREKGELIAQLPPTVGNIVSSGEGNQERKCNYGTILEQKGEFI